MPKVKKKELSEKIKEGNDFIPTGISPGFILESININNNNSNIINGIINKKDIEFKKH